MITNLASKSDNNDQPFEEASNPIDLTADILTSHEVEPIQQQELLLKLSNDSKLHQYKRSNSGTSIAPLMNETSPFNLERNAWNLYGALDVGCEVIENKGPVARDHVSLLIWAY